MKFLTKVLVATAGTAVAVAAVRRYDLLNKGAALFEQGVEEAAKGAEWLTAKATEVTERIVAEFAEGAEDQTEDKPRATGRPSGVQFGGYGNDETLGTDR
jgi:hypothetical protein